MLPPSALRAVLQQEKLLLPGDFKQGGNVCLGAAHVDGDEAGCSGSDSTENVAGSKVESFVNVGQNGNRPKIYDGSHNRGPHVGRHDDFLSRPDSQS